MAIFNSYVSLPEGVRFFLYNSAFSSHRFSTPDGVSAQLFGYFGWNRCHSVKMLFIDYWLVVSKCFKHVLFSISYMGCHPSH
jgi:hypothetical protein